MGLPARVGRQHLRLGLLVAVVLGLHLLLADQLRVQRMGWGAGNQPPPPIDVAFVRELIAAAPPAVVAPAPPPAAHARLPAVATKAKAAASAATPEPGPEPEPLTGAANEAISPAASASDPIPQAKAELASALPEVASAMIPASAPGAAVSPQQAAASAAAVPALAAASAAYFDWPPSTRMTYQLSGYYRGPVDGSAQVEWRREGTRYQVRMSTAIGPVLSRSISSDGELTEAGLVPRRFDGEQKVLFRAARRWSLRFGPERITLADGREIPTLPGAQDEASQFVQLSWLFTTRPELLQVGQSVELPLAISRSLDRWVYDVVGEEVLRFPFGAVATFHVKPRRAALGGDLSAEIWFAPSLQYLPVRILIRQNTESWVDLTLDKPPMQAATR